MTPEQLQTLKSYIVANPAWDLIPNTTDGAYLISLELNALASPAYIVWRTNTTVDEIMQNGFDWTRVDNLTVGKARIWEWMTKFNAFNPSKANIRAGIDAAWVGTAADLAVRAVIYTHCKRAATLGEKALATGTGTDALPATMGYEGEISWADIDAARHLP